MPGSSASGDLSVLGPAPERVVASTCGVKPDHASVLPVCASDGHFRRFREIACFAYERSPYYRKLYDAAGIRPDSAVDPLDLPLVSARDLAVCANDFRTDEPIYRVVGGSGTTGKPKLMYRSASDFTQSVRNERLLLEWSTVGPTDVVAVAQAFDLWASGELIQRAAAELGAMVVPVGLLPDADAHGILLKTNCTVIDTTPSRLRRLLLRSAGLAASCRPAIRVAMVSGEPLARDIPRLAREIWGAEVYDQYGSEETDALGGNRTPGSTISLLVDDFVFEVLDRLPGQRPEQFSGRLAVTSLYHRGTPLVRYVLDDLVRADRSTPDQVEILGRANECFFLYDSVKLHPYQVQAALDSAGFPELPWECTVEAGGESDRLKLRYYVRDCAAAAPHPSDIEEAMRRCTYEVEGLISMGDLEVSVERISGTPSASRRGKMARFRDLRAEKGRSA